MTDIEYRLQNWARVVRDGKTQGISSTGLLCDRLRMNAKKSTSPPNWDQDRFLKKQDEADVGDGWQVNEAWKVLHLRHREFLKYVYIEKRHPHRVCAQLSIRHREFDSSLRQAQEAILLILSKMHSLSEA